jgi:hypothetical protein
MSTRPSDASVVAKAAPGIGFEPCGLYGRRVKLKKASTGATVEKSRSRLEQTGSVAGPSQSPIITRPALPRSNQIHAMMFGLLFDNDNEDHRL